MMMMMMMILLDFGGYVPSVTEQTGRWIRRAVPMSVYSVYGRVVPAIAHTCTHLLVSLKLHPQKHFSYTVTIY